MGGSLVFVAIRCTLQYIVLPFLLPLLGLSGELSAYLSIILDVVAFGTIVYNIKQLWHTSWRWRYLALSAVMIVIISLFLYQDVRFLMSG
jgi:hypothetical protein